MNDEWECPYDELDPPVVELCRVLNRFDGIYTMGSCGGHDPQGDHELPGDEWRVTFQIELEDERPTAEGWIHAEFIAWAIYDMWQMNRVRLRSFALPPWLNFPGRMLRFQIEGNRATEEGIEPDDVAGFIDEAARQFLTDWKDEA